MLELFLEGTSLAWHSEFFFFFSSEGNLFFWQSYLDCFVDLGVFSIDFPEERKGTLPLIATYSSSKTWSESI